MPRPPVLPTIDWQSLFEACPAYRDWLAGSEHQDNAARVASLYDAVELPEPAAAFLKALGRRVHVIAIAEAWCGDVVLHVPVLQKMADASDWIEVRYLARESRPDVFARFLTNGGEAIPKFVFLSADFVECGNWGPMPSACRDIIARGKACNDVGAARTRVSGLYEADPACTEVVRELLHLFETASCRTP